MTIIAHLVSSCKQFALLGHKYSCKCNAWEKKPTEIETNKQKQTPGQLINHSKVSRHHVVFDIRCIQIVFTQCFQILKYLAQTAFSGAPVVKILGFVDVCVSFLHRPIGEIHRLDIGTEEDNIHQLDRAAQVTMFRLRTGHCQLFSHLHRLKISHSDECPWGTDPRTPNHILQSCPNYNTLRHQTWPSPVDVHRKLWEPVETLWQTADFVLLTRLKV